MKNFCNECGRSNEDDASYCGNCSATLNYLRKSSSGPYAETYDPRNAYPAYYGAIPKRNYWNYLMAGISASLFFLISLFVMT